MSSLISCKRAAIVAGFSTVQGVRVGLQRHTSSTELAPSMASAMMEVKVHADASDATGFQCRDIEFDGAGEPTTPFLTAYAAFIQEKIIGRNGLLKTLATRKNIVVSASTFDDTLKNQLKMACHPTSKIETSKMLLRGQVNSSASAFITGRQQENNYNFAQLLAKTCCQATAVPNVRALPTIPDVDTIERDEQNDAALETAIQASVDPNQSANREQAVRDLQAAQVPASGATPSSASATAPAADPATTNVPAAAAAAPAGAAEPPAKKAKKDSQCCGGR
ncbi:unnamed protein product [Amoebophrya sp. A25]|nr:unnamed protein product [Amoebophrya sp. A25]|eukprot:GSA25T00018592001.1